MSDDAFSRTSILYGEAFELGFNCALAGRSYLPKEPLHEFLESSHSSRNAARRRALTYMDICNKVLNSEDPIDAFLDYYSQFQRHNRSRSLEIKREELGPIDEMNIIGLVRVGMKTGKELLNQYDEFVLQPWILDSQTGTYLRPDVVAIKGDKPVAVGDLKVPRRFLSAELSSVVWSLNFDFYTFDDLISRAVSLPPWSFLSFFNALVRYSKVLKYALYLNRFPIEVLTIFPSGISRIHLHNEDDAYAWLDRFMELTESLLPKEFMERKSEILLGLIDGNAYIETVPGKNGNHYYLHIGNERVQIGTDMGFRKGRASGMVPVELRFHDDIDGRRENHKKDLMRLLKSHDIVIDASDQGIGKNHTISEYIAKELLDENKRTLIVAPRKRILLESRDKLKEGRIPAVLVVSKAERELVKEETYLNVLVVPDDSEWRATAMFKEALNSDVPVVLITTELFWRLSTAVWGEMLSAFDMMVFDELTNSGMPAVERVLSFLRLYSRHPENTKVVITDASITEPGLFLEAFLRHIKGQGDVYTPLEVLLSEEPENRPIIRDFKVGHLNGVYIRHHLDFPLAFYALGFTSQGVLPDWKALIERINRLMGNNFRKQLQLGKVVFYMDNRLYVDDLTAYLVSEGFEAVGVHSGTVNNYLQFNSNVVGTSSLAFGANLEKHNVLVFIPPFPDYNYLDHAHNVELYRQVIKRLRGEEGKTKSIVFVGLSREKKREGMYYHVTRNFIRKILTNRRFHVRLQMFSTDKGRFYSALDVPLGPEEKREVSLEVFLRDYLPLLKRILISSGFRINALFRVEFSKEIDWELPIPYRVYKIASRTVTENFGFEVRPMKEYANDAHTRLYRLINDSRYEKETKTLLKILGEDFDPLSFKNPYSLARFLERKLTPEFMFTDYSTLLLVPYVYPQHMETVPLLPNSPLKKVFLGDWRYFEMTVKVIEEVNGRKLHLPGIVAIHPSFGKPATRGSPTIVRRLREVLKTERIRRNTLYLPQMWKSL